MTFEALLSQRILGKFLVEAALQFDNNPIFANTIADLAISGGSSYEKFAQTPLTNKMLVSDVKARIDELYGGQGSLPDDMIENAVTHVLDHAYKVALLCVALIQSGQRSAGHLVGSRYQAKTIAASSGEYGLAPLPSVRDSRCSRQCDCSNRFLSPHRRCPPTSWRPPGCHLQAVRFRPTLHR